MKKILFFFCFALLLHDAIKAQDSITQEQSEDLSAIFDSIDQTMIYQHGKINLPGGFATIDVPAGYKYLDAPQAEKVLVDYWGNPKYDNMTLGMLLPEAGGVMSAGGYAFNLEFDEMGFVKDDDADDIDYDDLLKDLQNEMVEGNETRIAEGYEPIEFVGWASAPYYDNDRKILHWAKEIKFGESEDHTLNYNIRVLGRKGVLILNAIAIMNELQAVKTDVPKVLDVVKFTPGNTYADFKPGVDNVAAWTIGGLVAGKVLAKVGFFAIILKFGKVIILALIGGFAVFKKYVMAWFNGRKKKEDNITPEVNGQDLV